MSNRIRADIQIDHIHAHAICQSVGERLRDSLQRDWMETSDNLRTLIERLPELDREQSPSIVPSLLEAF